MHGRYRLGGVEDLVEVCEVGPDSLAPTPRSEKPLRVADDRVSAHLTEAASRTTLWSHRHDRGLDDIFAVQDEISESIAQALDQAFSKAATRPVDSAVYDLYLRSSPKSYAPDEQRTHVGVLELVTQRALHFAAAWGRLAYLRAFLPFYQPYAERAAGDR